MFASHRHPTPAAQTHRSSRRKHTRGKHQVADQAHQDQPQGARAQQGRQERAQDGDPPYERGRRRWRQGRGRGRVEERDQEARQGRQQGRHSREPGGEPQVVDLEEGRGALAPPRLTQRPRRFAGGGVAVLVRNPAVGDDAHERFDGKDRVACGTLDRRICFGRRKNRAAEALGRPAL